LFCACDGGRLIEVDADRGHVQRDADLAGVPDVIFCNPALERLYVAIGDPGTIEVFDTRSLKQVQSVVTEEGAHTLAFDAARNMIYAFLPVTHRVAVYLDRR
jgi:DNA-binding beta-propeller fold protein YncE